MVVPKRLSPASGGIGPGEHALLLNAVVMKGAAMSAGEDFGLCKKASASFPPNAYSMVTLRGGPQRADLSS